MGIVSHVKLMATIPYTTSQRIIDDWTKSLKDDAPGMYAKLLSRIPDESRFVERLAQPAQDGFKPFVNPGFVSKSGLPEQAIKSSQGSNLKRSYEKYRKKLQYYFETVDGIQAKRFKELVELMKDDFAKGVAERTLAFTGTKIEGRGLAPITALWLVNDVRVLDYLRAGDEILAGGPYLICPPGIKPALKAALNQRLIQAGAGIIKSEGATGAITGNNDRTNQIVQGFVDSSLGLEPFTTGGLSHVDFVVESGQLFLDVQVSTV